MKRGKKLGKNTNIALQAFEDLTFYLRDSLGSKTNLLTRSALVLIVSLLSSIALSLVGFSYHARMCEEKIFPIYVATNVIIIVSVVFCALCLLIYRTVKKKDDLGYRELVHKSVLHSCVLLLWSFGVLPILLLLAYYAVPSLSDLFGGPSHDYLVMSGLVLLTVFAFPISILVIAVYNARKIMKGLLANAGGLEKIAILFVMSVPLAILNAYAYFAVLNVITRCGA